MLQLVVSIKMTGIRLFPQPWKQPAAIIAILKRLFKQKQITMANNTSAGRRVAVIGSGISGITSAVMLHKCGFEVEIFEKSDQIGGVWALAYPNVHLQNIGEQYHISDFPWPFTPELHPTGTQIMQYLQEAVRHFGLDVHLRHQVAAMQEEPDGWLLGIEGPEGFRETRYDFVMVSNGHYSDGKNNLRFPDQELFQGRVMTERDLVSLDEFKGKRVAVVGFGKSAVDMTEFAAMHQAVQVFHVFRSPRWMIPRRILGVHFTNILFNRFGSVMMPSWSHPSGFERFIHEKSAGVIRLFWKKIEGVFRGHILKAGAGLGADARQRLQSVVPAHPLVADFRSASCLEPENYYRLVAEGRILPQHTEVLAFNRSGLHLKNGVSLDCDTVLLSLGSQTPVFPFLPAKYRTLLESEPDGVQLYRHLVHPRIPRVGFAGFNHCFMHVPSVEVGTLWIGALWKGELELPPIEIMEQSMAYLQAWKRVHMHYEPSRSCGVNTRFQQYLDILLKDLGVSPYRKLPNVAAEVFAKYRASDYAGVFREYQRRNGNAKVLHPSRVMH